MEEKKKILIIDFFSSSFYSLAWESMRPFLSPKQTNRLRANKSLRLLLFTLHERCLSFSHCILHCQRWSSSTSTSSLSSWTWLSRPSSMRYRTIHSTCSDMLGWSIQIYGCRKKDLDSRINWSALESLQRYHSHGQVLITGNDTPKGVWKQHTHTHKEEVHEWINFIQLFQENPP